MPSGPAVQPPLKRVFFSTRSTESDDAALLAIGLICEDGSSPCLLELHNAGRKSADDAVSPKVVSLFARAPAARMANLAALGQRLGAHIATFGEPIALCHEHAADWQRLESALMAACTWHDAAPLVHARHIAREITAVDPLVAPGPGNALETANALRERWLGRPATDRSPCGKLRAFLGYHGADDRGGTLYALLSQSDEWMASHRTFIQWMLPIAEPSAVQQRGPLLTLAEFERLSADARVRRGIGLSRDRLLKYLGLDFRDGRLLQRPDPQAVEGWGRHAGPDDLRISRMLRSLALVGLGDGARALYREFEALIMAARGAEAAQAALAYWRAAAFKQSGQP